MVDIDVSVDYLPTDRSYRDLGASILTRRRCPARAFRLLALSATVVAGTPGVALGIDATAQASGWVAGSVRVEPLAGAGGLTLTGSGTYRGALDVVRNGKSLAVVNVLGLEDYVRGIDEVPPTWPAAALQAQAVAARTYAAHKAVVTQDDRWRAVGADICATATCQVYRGLDAEHRAGGTGWLAAVEATAGRALLAGGQPIMASYSSTANGPRAMSQNGALALAQEGRSASDILDSFYGVRPTLATDRLPTMIKVALVMSSASVRITATGPFRVLDGTGAVLATGAAGEWRVVADGTGTRVIPPASYLSAAVAATPDPAVDTTRVRRTSTRAITATSQPAHPGSWARTGIAVVVLAFGTSAGLLLSRSRRAGPAGRSRGTASAGLG